MARLNIDARNNGLTVIVTIKRYNEWRFRLWVALKIIKFAAWLAWVDIEINNETKDGEL